MYIRDILFIELFWISAALYVSRKEVWRRSVVWRHVQYFASLTKVDITSPIISIVVGSEQAALRAGRFTLCAPNIESSLSLLHVADIYIYIFKMQAFAKIWISCYTNPTAHSATQLLQVQILLCNCYFALPPDSRSLSTRLKLCQYGS